MNKIYVIDEDAMIVGLLQTMEIGEAEAKVTEVMEKIELGMFPATLIQNTIVTDELGTAIFEAEYGVIGFTPINMYKLFNREKLESEYSILS